jgi:hypothetical protein
VVTVLAVLLDPTKIVSVITIIVAFVLLSIIIGNLLQIGPCLGAILIIFAIVVMFNIPEFIGGILLVFDCLHSRIGTVRLTTKGIFISRYPFYLWPY